MSNIDGDELYLYIKNDGDLYRKVRSPMETLLRKKHASGAYLHVRAVDAFKRLADVGAKKYAAEFGGEFKALPSARKACAEMFARDLESELAISGKTAAQLEREIKTEMEKQRAGARRKPGLYR